MSTQDQNFFNLFLVVIGILIGIAVFLIFLARMIAGGTQVAWVQTQPAYLAAVEERIQPAGSVALPGDEPAAAGATAPPAAGAPAAPAAAKLTGEQVYQSACFACHGAGVAGAPKLGDSADWGARLARGRDLLNQHSIEGFQGETGYMPPKGGRVDLSDEEVIAAVDYMLGEST